MLKFIINPPLQTVQLHGMIHQIPTYELPDKVSHGPFQVYEVKGIANSSKQYPHKTEIPHRHSYYEICLFVSGAGKHEIDFEAYSIRSHSVHFLTPGQVHLISREKDYHGYLIVFSGNFYSIDGFSKDLLFDYPFFNNPAGKPILNLSGQEFEDLMQLADLMKKEYLSKSQTMSEILRAYLHAFLLKCRQFHLHYFAEEEKMHDPQFLLVQQFKTLVEQHFKKMHLVQDYSLLLGLSPAKINKMTKRITGKNAGEIIIERLILEARRMLMYTDLSNKEIAYKLNYEDPSYFSRIFKKKTGLSPSEFKSHLNEKYQILT
ncbi:MAG: helix-turn-helix domain-containing protein [Cyclobacteriaceae bacterium]